MTEKELETVLALLAEAMDIPLWDKYALNEWRERVAKFLTELTAKPRL